MLIKLIACEVFTREVCHCVANSPHVVDLEFTPKGAHDDPDVLRELIQARIDEAHRSDKEYDAVVLCLGICGNATVGLVTARLPLVIPRAHDCCTIYLGSKHKFIEHFGENPSMPFSSVGYIEHGGSYMHESDGTFSGSSQAGPMSRMGMDKSYDDYVKEHGEENAKFIWEALHPNTQVYDHGKLVFIEIPQFVDSTHAEACRKQAEADGKQFIKIEGSLELIRKLVHGEWNEEEFLVVNAGQRIAGVYDLQEVVKVG